MYIKGGEQYLDYLHQVFNTLKTSKLYVNLKKCRFFNEGLIFLGYVVSRKGNNIDPSKVEVILNWPALKSLHKV